MSDINSLLSKHFAGEASPAEEELVQQFKSEQAEEYAALKAFWSTKNISVEPFNNGEAWKKVVRKAPKPKPRSIYRRLSIAAAVAAVLLVVSLFGIKYLYQNEAALQITVATELERNKKVELPDGSVVYLNKNASLSYPETFDKHQRKVTLKGEAFFEVTRDTKRPFRITTEHSEVEVLGTSFNINTNQNQTEVAVATGKVKVQSLFEEKSAVLTPNNSAIITSSELTAFPTEKENYLAWKTGIFKFKKQPIKKVIADLNTYYPNPIILSNKNANCILTSTYNKDDLKEILEIIQLTCDLKLKQKNGSYELY